MIGFKLPETPLNLQKCLLPDSFFLQKYSGRYCIIAVRGNEQKFLVNLGLHEIKAIEKSFFFDGSVTCFNNLSRINHVDFTLDEVSFDDFIILKAPVVAKSVCVIVIFSSVFDVEKFNRRPNELITVIGQILRMFVMCNNSSLTLANFSKKQTFGIESIIVTHSDVKNREQPFEINVGTAIQVEKCITRLKFEQIYLERRKSRVKGCIQAYEFLREAVQLVQLAPEKTSSKNKILILGPRGSGKTCMVYNVAFDCKCIVLEVLLSEIKSQGEKIFRNVFNKVKLYTKFSETCIVLIRNIHLICQKKSDKKSMGLLSIFLEDLEKLKGILVMATTNSLESIDIQLRKHKRFEEIIEIAVPDLEERENLIRQLMNSCSISCNEMIIKRLAKQTPGFVGADLKLLVIEALILLNKIQESGQDVKLEGLEDCLRMALKKVIPSGLRGGIGVCINNDASFGNIGGLEKIKRTLDLAVKRQLENPCKFHNLGVPLTKGILLYGPPGCAKTTLAKAVANESQARLLMTSAAELYSPYVGDAEKKVAQVFAQARNSSPAIIFIDEIDAVVGNKRGERERGVQERILSTLLVEMDGVGMKVNTGKKGENGTWNDGVIVIGATNHPQALDDALKRPGRFDKLIYIPPPDVEERFLILKKLTAKMAIDESVDLKRLAELTSFYSGADLKSLCRESGLQALNSSSMTAERISQHHFEEIIADLKPSLNEKTISFYEAFQRFNE